MDDLPAGIVAHVLPTGCDDAGTGVSSLRPWDLRAAGERIARAYEATSDYLDRLTQAAG
jgi:hypothetical protein